jgi:hypothetical protein
VFGRQTAHARGAAYNEQHRQAASTAHARALISIASVSVSIEIFGMAFVVFFVSETLSEKEISGGVVHDLPADLRKALTSDTKALETWEDINSARAKRMDLLDRVGKKNRNKNSPDRMGLFRSQRRKAETLLLAWLSASLKAFGTRS